MLQEFEDKDAVEQSGNPDVDKEAKEIHWALQNLGRQIAITPT